MLFGHFTPSKILGSNASTGNIESIYKNGLRCYSSCVTLDNLELAWNFSHHATRNNRKGLWACKVQGAFVVWDCDIIKEQGYDGPGHIQVNQIVKTKPLGWFEFSSKEEFLAKIKGLTSQSF